MDIVNENATFQHDDIFHRLDFAKKAMALIESHPAERGACVVSIDAPWGMGKSTFLRMWKNELDSYNQKEAEYQEPLFTHSANSCIYYNAWENDYYENAFIPLLFTMCGSLSTEIDEKEEKKLSLLQKVVGAAAGVLGYFACVSTTQDQGLATAVGGLAGAATESIMKMFKKEDLDAISQNYLKDIEMRQDFRNAVSDLAQEAGKLFFFIDELDRCKPLFAIQTLECIKHFFNIPNVVFVFATDINQLAHSIAGIYGQGINAGGYLSKFFDYQLHLPVPDIKDLMQYAYPAISTDSSFYEIMNEIRGAFILTPREAPIVINQAQILWEALKLKSKVPYYRADYCFLYIVLLFTLKYKMPEHYAEVFQGMYNWNNKNNEKSFAVVNDFLSFTNKWVRKTPTYLQKEIERIANEERRARNITITMTYGEDETAWLGLIFAICNCQHFGSQTIGDILHSTLEIFSIKNE